MATLPATNVWQEEQRVRSLLRNDLIVTLSRPELLAARGVEARDLTDDMLRDAAKFLNANIAPTWVPANPTAVTDRGDGFADVFMSDGSMHVVQIAKAMKNVPTARLRVKLKTGAKRKEAPPAPVIPEKMQAGNAVRLNGETKTFADLRREKGNDDALRFMIALFNELGFHVAEMRQVRRGGGHAMFRVTRGGA